MVKDWPSKSEQVPGQYRTVSERLDAIEDRIYVTIDGHLTTIDAELVRTVAVISADYLLATTDVLVLVDATDADREITLLIGSLVGGRDVAIKKVDATGHRVVVKVDGGGLIDGEPQLIITDQNVTLHVMPYGPNWVII